MTCGNINAQSEEKLLSFARLSKGWNGFDAEPFSEELIISACTILGTITARADVFPLTDGRIQMEFDKDDGSYLELVLGTNERVEVFQIDADQTEKEYEVSFIQIRRTISDFYDG